MQKGDLVYFVDSPYQDNHIYYGILDEFMSNRAHIALVGIREDRIISSEYIPHIFIDDFQSETVWHKYPKGWTYNTELFHITSNLTAEEKAALCDCNITHPNEIFNLMDKGILVLESTKYHGEITAECDRHKGWRVVKQYPEWTLTYGESDPSFRTVLAKNVFCDYESARKRLAEILETVAKEQKMSDAEWSWKEIEITLRQFTSTQAAAYRKALKKFSNIEDIEVRKNSKGLLDWKMWRDSIWKPVRGLKP